MTKILGRKEERKKDEKRDDIGVTQERKTPITACVTRYACDEQPLKCGNGSI